jgi:hypothetical protein
MQWEGVDLAAAPLTCTQAKTGAIVTAPLHPALLAQLNRLAEMDRPQAYALTVTSASRTNPAGQIQPAESSPATAKPGIRQTIPPHTPGDRQL